MQPFLTPDDAQAIDKYLAHITTMRSDIFTKPWLIDDMVILGLQHGVEFLTILETSPATRPGLGQIGACAYYFLVLIEFVAAAGF